MADLKKPWLDPVWGTNKGKIIGIVLAVLLGWVVLERQWLTDWLMQSQPTAMPAVK